MFSSLLLSSRSNPFFHLPSGNYLLGRTELLVLNKLVLL